MISLFWHLGKKFSAICIPIKSHYKFTSTMVVCNTLIVYWWMVLLLCWAIVSFSIFPNLFYQRQASGNHFSKMYFLDTESPLCIAMNISEAVTNCAIKFESILFGTYFPDGLVRVTNCLILNTHDFIERFLVSPRFTVEIFPNFLKRK